MNNSFPYRSSKSRPTKQQLQQKLMSEQILTHLATLQDPVDAQSLWLEMSAGGARISMSSFNNRLKKLVEADLIVKISYGYNKHLYQLTSKNNAIAGNNES